MNEELTNEVLERIRDCCGKCSKCPAIDHCNNIALATALLEERAKPKVWDGAPEDAVQAQVTWFTKCGGYTGMQKYTLELPKTRARQIAEKEGHGLAEKYGWNAAAKELVTNVMEAALNKYAEELEGKE